MVKIRCRSKRLFCLVVALASVGSRASSPTMTTVSDIVLHRANGQPAQDNPLISWPAFTTSDDESVVAGMGVVIGANGQGNVSRVPNTNGTPSAYAGTQADSTVKSENSNEINNVDVDASTASKVQSLVHQGSKYRPASHPVLDIVRDCPDVRANGIDDDRAAVQACIDVHPGTTWHFQQTANDSTPSYRFTGPLYTKGNGFIMECDGAAPPGRGTILKWDKAVGTGIVVLNSNGTGEIRNCALVGSQSFLGVENGPWSDAIIPSGANLTIANRNITSISRSHGVTTVKTDGIANNFCHTYSAGTQITIAGVTENPSFDGVYFITGVSAGGSAALMGCKNQFTYAQAGAPDVSAFRPAAGITKISTTGPYADVGILAAANFLKLTNVHLKNWNFGIKCETDSATHWCDDQVWMNLSAFNGPGIGFYLRGGDANASSFTHIVAYVNLVGGLFDISFLGNTYSATQMTSNGYNTSVAGPTEPITSISRAGNTVTLNASNHGFVVGQAIVVTGQTNDTSFNTPTGSAFFVAGVPDANTITYTQTGPNATPTPVGTVRLATGAELFTSSGLPHFGYYVAGLNDSRTMIQPYAEGSNGCNYFGSATLLIDPVFGNRICPGYEPQIIRNGETNVTAFNGDLLKGTGAVERGTSLFLRGGQNMEQDIKFYFQNHTGGAEYRWIWSDTVTPGNKGLHFYRGNHVNDRLYMVAGDAANTLPGHTIINAEGAGAIDFNSLDGSGGVNFYNGSGTRVASLDGAGTLRLPRITGITDTGVVKDLNADTVDGKHASDFAPTGFSLLTFSATPTFDATVASTFKMILRGNVTSSTVSNAAAGRTLTFIVCQDATGNHTFSWPSNVKGAMSVGTMANKCSVQMFVFDGTSGYAFASGVINQ